MGCDIHIAIEVQQAGSWQEVSYARVFRFQRDANPEIGHGLLVCPDQFRNRCYDLFAILANVRNGTGFGGCLTGNGWPSIAADRGFPCGFNPDAVAADPLCPEDGPKWMGDHSFTWLGLEELESFDWDGVKSTQYALVTAAEYERLLTTKSFRPKKSCGGVSGAGVRVYTPVEYALAKADGALVSKPYVRVAWEDSAREATGDWAGTCLPWLRNIAQGRPLRLVLGFDS